MPRPEHHDEVQLNFLQSGWMTYLLGGCKTRLVAGCISAFWAAIPHQIVELGTDKEYFVATIPFAWFLRWRLPDEFVQSMLRGGLHIAPSPCHGKRDRVLFAQWEDDLQTGRADAYKRDIVLFEMRARLMRLAAALSPRTAVSDKPSYSPAILRDGGLNRVEQIACFIAQRYTEQLSVEEIGRVVGLHPNYAMRLFRESFGETLVQYLIHQRVAHSRRLLATTDMKVTDVAFESGFNSTSRFNDSFRRTCGCSPREYRLRHKPD
jgi:AraC family transcriptional regulator, melibiose operon regulatory protein